MAILMDQDVSQPPQPRDGPVAGPSRPTPRAIPLEYSAQFTNDHTLNTYVFAESEKREETRPGKRPKLSRTSVRSTRHLGTRAHQANKQGLHISLERSSTKYQQRLWEILRSMAPSFDPKSRRPRSLGARESKRRQRQRIVWSLNFWISSVQMLNEGVAAQNRMAAGTASLRASASFNKNFIVRSHYLSLRGTETLTVLHSAGDPRIRSSRRLVYPRTNCWISSFACLTSGAHGGFPSCAKRLSSRSSTCVMS
jgi:hypothetical protein